MASKRIFQKVEDKYGGRIASLLGVDQANVTFQVTNLEPGMAANANADTGVIQVDRGFLKRTNQGRADVRGALIHELAHAYGAGYGTDKAETYADYARYALNPREAAYWKPSEAVLTMANTTGTNGPRPERTTGRSRDTVVNNASKAPPAPPVSPASAANLGDQMAQGTYQYLQQLALLKQQLGMAKVDRADAMAAARAQRVTGMAGAVNQALESNMVGSSIDLAARAGVVAQQTADQQAALRSFQAASASTQQDQLNAAAQYSQLQASIANARAAERMAALQEAYYKGLYDPAVEARAARTGERPRSRNGTQNPPASTAVSTAERYQQYIAAGVPPAQASKMAQLDERRSYWAYGPDVPSQDPNYLANRYAAGRM